MGRHPKQQSDPHQRLLLAQTAARLMADSGLRDFAAAKRKAAVQLGIHNSRNLPGNDEIEQALHEYQRLFQQHTQGGELTRLRQSALQAMKALAPFAPRLVGPVLSGSADRHTPIYLHLFTDSSEEVSIFLMEHKIPFEQGERRVHYAGSREERRPLFRFYAGDHAIELTIFPHNGIRQHPLSPVDGKTMRRASIKELEQLLAVD
jgi:hypothetical protein